MHHSFLRRISVLVSHNTKNEGKPPLPTGEVCTSQMDRCLFISFEIWSSLLQFYGFNFIAEKSVIPVGFLFSRHLLSDRVRLAHLQMFVPRAALILWNEDLPIVFSIPWVHLVFQHE